eukprot:TRINITY_DN5520_c0_g1_i15.p2 TRINITY_DN5520_c0_g1~~TRINITY_DN5520_c0_g1_i15.p2  ORF type:complete len:189 (+),score=-17.40 TRINITY_DN5520_c0_g1_i15:155-721(+)
MLKQNFLLSTGTSIVAQCCWIEKEALKMHKCYKIRFYQIFYICTVSLFNYFNLNAIIDIYLLLARIQVKIQLILSSLREYSMSFLYFNKAHIFQQKLRCQTMLAFCIAHLLLLLLHYISNFARQGKKLIRILQYCMNSQYLEEYWECCNMRAFFNIEDLLRQTHLVFRWKYLIIMLIFYVDINQQNKI